MADITAAMVKELRERTQAGMADCKNALVEARRRHGEGRRGDPQEGDRQGGVSRRARRGRGRGAHVGRARRQARRHRRGQLPDRLRLARRRLQGPSSTGVLEVGQDAPKGGDLGAHKFPGHRQDGRRGRARRSSRKTGENIVVRRWAALEAKEPNGLVHAYVHMGGKLAVLLQAEAPNAAARANPDFTAFVDNAAMQIAAMSPIVVAQGRGRARRTIDKQKRDLRRPAQGREASPKQAWPKIIDGKVAKWFTEVTLLGQDNVWDPPARARSKASPGARQEARRRGEDPLASCASRSARASRRRRRPRRRSREDDRQLIASESGAHRARSAPSASISTRSRTTSRSTVSPSRQVRRARSSTTWRSTGSSRSRETRGSR